MRFPQIVVLLFFLLPSGYSQDIPNQEIFETWLESKMVYEKWPGAVIGIVKDQRLAWVGTYGYSDLEKGIPMDASLHFAIGSNTKMLTAIAVMKLRNQGLLNLDDPVYKYIPEVLDIKPIEGADPKDITIRHILTHTSGLPVEPWYFNWEIRPTPDEIIDNLEKQTLGIPTSVDFKYSNLGFSLLGSIIENISGKGYSDFMEEEVLKPVGMQRSHYELNEKIQYAQGYQPLRGEAKRKAVKLLEYRGWAPGGGLYSNLNDLSNYVSWFLRTYHNQDTTVLNAPTLRDMIRVGWVPDSWNYGIGLGFFIYKGEDKMVGHGGHNPGFKTDITIFPDAKLGVITLTNGEDVNIYPDEEGSLPAQVIKYLLPHFKEAALAEPNSYALNKDLYEGVYSGYWADYKIAEIDGVLTISRITNDRADLFQLKIKPEGNHTFKVFSEDMGRWRGEMIYFQELKNGQMHHLLMDGTTFYRKN